MLVYHKLQERQPGNDHEKEIAKSKVVQNGKAQHITLLHTADIHAQLYTHDEFFWENGKAVYKKRGGLAVLKTMLLDLKKQNAGNKVSRAHVLFHNLFFLCNRKTIK